MKNLPLELEIQNLADAKAKSLIYTRPLRATSYQLIWVSEGEAIFDIDFNKKIINKLMCSRLEKIRLHLYQLY